MIINLKKWVYKGLGYFFCLKVKRLSERATKHTTVVASESTLQRKTCSKSTTKKDTRTALVALLGCLWISLKIVFEVCDGDCF